MGQVATQLGQLPQTAKEGVPGSNAAGCVIKVRHAKLIRPGCSERSRQAECCLVPVHIGRDPTSIVTCGGWDMPTSSSCVVTTTRFCKDRRCWWRRQCIFCHTAAAAPQPVLRVVCLPCGQSEQWAVNRAGDYGVLWLHVRSMCCRALHCVAAGWNAPTPAVVRCAAGQCGRKMVTQINE